MKNLLAALMLLFVVPVSANDLDTPLTKMAPVKAPVAVREAKASVYQVSAVELMANRPLDEAAKNAVIVEQPTGGNGSYRGSGCYLGDRFVSTANHVVPSNTPGRVIFRDGKRHGFRVHSRDTQWDIAILEIEPHPSLPGVPIATADVRQGETVYSMGFGSGFRVFGGPIQGFVGNQNGGNDWFNHRNGAVSGDSGGPVFRTNGEMVGVLWGTGGGNTYASRTRRFRLLCQPLFPRLAQWRSNRLARLGVTPQNPYASQNCPDGNCPLVPPQNSPSSPITYPDPVAPTDTPQAGCNCDQEAVIAAIIDRIKNDPELLERIKGEAGPPGPQGPPGATGTRGEQPSESDLSLALRKYISENQDEFNISLALVNEDGVEIDRDTVSLGGTLKLQLYSKE